MNSFFKTIGISLLIMLISSFVGILLIKDVVFLSVASSVVTYVINGYVASQTNQRFPYYNAYMTALFLTVVNVLFYGIVIGLNVLLNVNVVFYSILVAASLSLLGAYVRQFVANRRLKDA